MILGSSFKKILMKKVLQTLIVLAFLPAISKAQITIQANDVQPLGVFATQSKDTTLAASITPGGTGLQTWDFSALKAQTTDSLEFYEADQTAYASLFPSANLAATLDSFAVIYLEKNDDHIITLGTYGSLAFPPYIVTAAYKYNPPQTIIRFPMELNQAFTENVKATVQITGATIGLPYDSVRAVTFTSRSVVVDAYGQLTTPIGVFEVLRSKEVETSIDSAYIQSSGIWFPLQGSAPKTITFHNWWSKENGFGFPVVQHKNSPDTGNSALWLNEFVSSTHESKSYLRVNIWPNPTSNTLNVELPASFSGQMEVFDLNGRRLLAQSTADTSQESLNLQAFPVGSYVLILKNKKGKVAGFQRFEVVR